MKPVSLLVTVYGSLFTLRRRFLRMFCPRCAAQNTEEAKFCRSCGADISLVPQALTGALAGRLAAGEESPLSRRDRRHARRHDGKPVNIERAVRSFFMGLAFIF